MMERGVDRIDVLSGGDLISHGSSMGLRIRALVIGISLPSYQRASAFYCQYYLST